MSDFIFSVLMFLVAISILVAVHEFGHFWVAKKLGVKVLRFSIGMGKPFLTKRAGKDQTEYALAPFPIGGYVKMLDERDGEVAPEEVSRAFNRQPVWKKACIVLAGPVFNLIFAVIVYAIIYMAGVDGAKLIITDVLPGSQAEVAGLPKGAEVTAVDGIQTPNIEEAMYALLPAIVSKKQITIEVKNADGQIQTRSVDLSKVNLNKDLRDPFKSVGIVPYFVPIEPVLTGVAPGGPAEAAGLQAGDKIVKLDNMQITDFRQIPEYLQKQCSDSTLVTFEREGKLATASVANKVTIQFGRAVRRFGIEIGSSGKKFPSEYKTHNEFGVLESFDRAITRTKTMTLVTLQLIWKIVTLEFSFTNVGSVIQIAGAAGQSASLGLDRFLIFLALVSISLGIMNLMPIPILDGGHLLYHIMESITGKPVPEAWEDIGVRIGIAMLFTLMALAFYNDIMRMIFPEYGLQDCPRT